MSRDEFENLYAMANQNNEELISYSDFIKTVKFMKSEYMKYRNLVK